MKFVIVGAGYTGLSVIKRLSKNNTMYISRTRNESLSYDCEIIDLDNDINPIKIEIPYTLLYTVPPNPRMEIDSRLPSFLKNISPLPKRIVYMSTSGVYGDQDGRLVNELITPEPQTTRAKKRLVAEQFLNHWCSKKDIQLIILRVSGIYGPERLGLDRIDKDLTIINEHETTSSNRIHIDDLTTCCIAALENKNASGIYNISDGNFRSNTWFIKKLCELKNLPPPREISREEALRSWSKKRISFLRESRCLDTRKLHEELEIKLLYADAEIGIKASI